MQFLKVHQKTNINYKWCPYVHTQLKGSVPKNIQHYLVLLHKSTIYHFHSQLSLHIGRYFYSYPKKNPPTHRKVHTSVLLTVLVNPTATPEINPPSIIKICIHKPTIPSVTLEKYSNSTKLHNAIYNYINHNSDLILTIMI